jgi:hypothetical protein
MWKHRGVVSRGSAAALAALLMLAGCEGYELEQRWESRLVIEGPLRAGDELLYVNRTFGELVRVGTAREAGQAQLKVQRIELGERLGARAQSADGRFVYVIDNATRTLHIVELGETLTKRTIQLSSAYNRIDVDPYGEFLLLNFSGQDVDQDERQRIARNVNEVGVVDLRSDSPSAAFVTLSSRARSFEFAAPFELGGQRQRLVAALADGGVTIMDLLADADDRLREVPLTLSQAERQRAIRQALFDVTPSEEQPDTAFLYLLTDDASDITQVSIQPTLDPRARRKLDLSVNQLAAGADPGQMALLELERGERLMVLDRRSSRFTLVDTASGEGATFDLGMGAAGQSLHVYLATPRDGDQATPELRVLVTNQNSPLAAVVRPETIALATDQPTLGRSVEAIRLPASPSRVLMSDPSAERAIAFHAGITGGFSVINLRDNRTIPIQGHSLEDLVFSGEVGVGLFRGASWLGVFELSSGHPSVYELPLPGRTISVNERDHLVLVEHEGQRGRFTVLDANELTPETSRVYRDIFLDALFEKELP